MGHSLFSNRMEEDVRHCPVSQLMGWTCFQSKYWTASGSRYFSISLPISPSISTIVNQLWGELWTPLLQHAVLWTVHLESWGLHERCLVWMKSPLVLDACSTYPHWPCCIKHSSSCLGYMMLGSDWCNLGIVFKLCCIVSLKSHFFPSTFFFSEYFSGISNTSVLAAIVVIILGVVFAEWFYWFPHFPISTLLREHWWKISPEFWHKRSSWDGVCR